MKEAILNIIQQSGTLSWNDIIINIVMSSLLGVLIFISYALSHRGTIYSKKFNVSLILLATLTGTVMTVIGNNVALSLGMVGALSIVRFRTAVKDSRDTMFIFWAIIVGICCGVGDYRVAAIGSTAAFIIMLLMGAIKSDGRILLIIRGSRESIGSVQSQIFKIFDRKAVMRVNNTTDTSFELIYEISEKMLRKAEQTDNNITDKFYSVGKIEYVNFVKQNDDISS